MTDSGPLRDATFSTRSGVGEARARSRRSGTPTSGSPRRTASSDIRLDGRAVRRVRVELPRGQLRLQSIGIEADGMRDVDDIGLIRIRTSSHHPDAERDLDPATLFDFDDPKGTMVHTRADHPARVDIVFERPQPMTRIRLRNAIGETAREARGIRVRTGGRWRTRVIYDGRAALREWKGLVAATTPDVALQPGSAALLAILDFTVRANYERAHRLFVRVADEDARRWFQDAVNEALLPARGLEWTVHGPRRPFRMWTDAERAELRRRRRGGDRRARVAHAQTCASGSGRRSPSSATTP